jgi:hypothetical protein
LLAVFEISFGPWQRAACAFTSIGMLAYGVSLIRSSSPPTSRESS